MTKVETWDDFLELLIETPQFKNQITEKGFFKTNDSLKKFSLQYGFNPIQNTATYLSLDFWSQQSKILRNHGLYLLRTGSGTFGIFDETIFPKPYLELNVNHTEKLDLEIDPDFNELMSAFDTRQENAGLEHLNACGVYDLIIKKLWGKKEWKLGPRGNKNSEFRVFGKNTQNQIIPLYDFKGQEELDYGIWTRDEILLIEAKSLEPNYGLDIGWHKLSYPASRFKKFKKYSVIPIYLLKWKNISHLFIFPKIVFHNNDGIIINDRKQLTPERIFRIEF